MDVRHAHGTDVHVVRACYHEDGTDLVAVGGNHTVEVLLTTPTTCEVIASFHIGTRITALAWSSNVTSPSVSDEWSFELAAAGADFGLFLLSKTVGSEEDVFPFGGGLSGHHGKVNDMAFCGGRTEDSSRYVATVSDDKMLMVWDLDPSIVIASPPLPEVDEQSGLLNRPQPTAYVVAFPHPLTTVNSHPTTSKEFLVSDCRGSIFLTDWRSDPDEGEQGGWRSSVLELVEPRALSDSVTGLATKWSGSVSWRRDSADVVGAAYGSKFAIWDMANLQGGKPSVSGASFTEGGNHFRWCPTYHEYFAISAAPPTKGAVIHLYNTGYIQAQPTVYNIGSRPLYVRTFDFMADRGIPRIVAGVGREVVIFYIGDDS
ncbi:WD40-repeat-containing domain protein [Sparassis latifolia]|uniref:Uncharacterized protein n=1 Tax=Sparassis crispa TaxID=139825 RepID=A0A401GK82_9APHY|nr:hypothetical protein SCP_0409540 [Sparassis crispa]GBE82570.1 hypothetical protein SCP_0409540 [Sparassis crispa]